MMRRWALRKVSQGVRNELDTTQEVLSTTRDALERISGVLQDIEDHLTELIEGYDEADED